MGLGVEFYSFKNSLLPRKILFQIKLPPSTSEYLFSFLPSLLVGCSLCEQVITAVVDYYYYY
jgi:hypothetical protein